MNHRIVIRYPFAPAVLLRALITPQFHVDKALRLGAFRCELLEQGTNGTAMTLRMRRRMPTAAPGPRALAKLIPPALVVEHHDQWDASSGCGLIAVQIAHAPVRLRARASVLAIESGCEHRFDWEIAASIPLVGGALERFIAQDLDRGLQIEATVVREMLAQ